MDALSPRRRARGQRRKPTPTNEWLRNATAITLTTISATTASQLAATPSASAVGTQLDIYQQDDWKKMRFMTKLTMEGLKKARSGASEFYTGSGSFVGPDAILTSAHNIWDEDELTVLPTKNMTVQYLDIYGKVQKADVASIHINPDFESLSRLGGNLDTTPVDAAVVKLKKPVNDVPILRVIGDPGVELNQPPSGVKAQARVFGWEEPRPAAHGRRFSPADIADQAWIDLKSKGKPFYLNGIEYDDLSHFTEEYIEGGAHRSGTKVSSGRVNVAFDHQGVASGNDDLNRSRVAAGTALPSDHLKGGPFHAGDSGGPLIALDKSGRPVVVGINTASLPFTRFSWSGSNAFNGAMGAANQSGVVRKVVKGMFWDGLTSSFAATPESVSHYDLDPLRPRPELPHQPFVPTPPTDRTTTPADRVSGSAAGQVGTAHEGRGEFNWTPAVARHGQNASVPLVPSIIPVSQGPRVPQPPRMQVLGTVSDDGSFPARLIQPWIDRLYADDHEGMSETGLASYFFHDLYYGWPQQASATWQNAWSALPPDQRTGDNARRITVMVINQIQELTNKEANNYHYGLGLADLEEIIAPAKEKLKDVENKSLEEQDKTPSQHTNKVRETGTDAQAHAPAQPVQGAVTRSADPISLAARGGQGAHGGSHAKKRASAFGDTGAGELQSRPRLTAVQPNGGGGDTPADAVGGGRQAPATSTVGGTTAAPTADSTAASGAAAAEAGNQQSHSAPSSSFTWVGDHHEYTGAKNPHWTWAGNHDEGGRWTYNPDPSDAQQQQQQPPVIEPAPDSGPARPIGSDGQTAPSTDAYEAPGKPWEETLNRGARAINDIVNGNSS